MSSENGRPRRSARTVAKAPATVITSNTPARTNKKRKDRDSEKESIDKLDNLLTNPKSKLSRVDLSEVLNYERFLDLSSESQDLLVSLLPPTAFFTFRSSIPPTHIDYAASEPQPSSSSIHTHDGSIIDSSAAQSAESQHVQSIQQQNHEERSTATLDPMSFNSPFFLSAVRTFQDHLVSGWLGKNAQADVAQFKAGISDRSMHAEWKDEAWEQSHTHTEGSTTSSSLDLRTLAQQGLLKDHDILSYRREFSRLDVIVEKDVLVDSINPRGHGLRVVLPPKTSRDLGALVSIGHEGPDPGDHLQQMQDVTDPDVLENGILDIDGRVSRDDRLGADYAAKSGPLSEDAVVSVKPSNAAEHISWKSFTVWRWRDEMRDAVQLQVLQDRGGRERCHDKDEDRLIRILTYPEDEAVT